MIKKLSIANDKVYIQTYKKSNGKFEFYIFDIHGKLIKRIFLPIYQMYKGFIFLYPFTIQNEKLYQLVENDKSEVWELHITEIDL